MAKNKPPKYIIDRREEGPPARHKEESGKTKATIPQILKPLKILVGLITLLATILGLVTGYLSLIPRISVVQNQPLNVSDPFSTPFILSNDGPLGVNELEFSCLVFKVDQTGGGGVTGAETSMGLAAKRMEPGERATIPCSLLPFALTSPLKSGDVAVRIIFRPDFVFWRKSRAFRFITFHASDGHLYWYPQPISGPPSNENPKNGPLPN